MFCDVPVNPLLQALAGVLVSVVDAETDFRALGSGPALVCGSQARRGSSNVELTEIAATNQRLSHGTRNFGS
jgi:hypothetical protein